nr:four helix bundle protein [Ferruginibacter lapsinanis]
MKVWQKAKSLCSEIFEMTSKGKFSNDFALIDQINKSSGSVMDNIAEGFGRMGNKEFINFLTYANASLLECNSQVYRAFDRNYIIQEAGERLFRLIEEIGKMINTLIVYLRKSDFRGQKSKERPTTKE